MDFLRPLEDVGETVAVQSSLADDSDVRHRHAPGTRTSGCLLQLGRSNHQDDIMGALRCRVLISTKTWAICQRTAQFPGPGLTGADLERRAVLEA